MNLFKEISQWCDKYVTRWLWTSWATEVVITCGWVDNCMFFLCVVAKFDLHI